MLGILAKLFGGSKSDKDVKKLQPIVAQVNRFYDEYQSLSNDDLRNKTQEFRARIKEHLTNIDQQIADKKAEADSVEDIQAREGIYNEVDKLVKKRDEQIEEILNIILPEAFAVVKETAHRFKDNTEIVANATEMDIELANTRKHIRIRKTSHHFVHRIPGRPSWPASRPSGGRGSLP